MKYNQKTSASVLFLADALLFVLTLLVFVYLHWFYNSSEIVIIHSIENICNCWVCKAVLSFIYLICSINQTCI